MFLGIEIGGTKLQFGVGTGKDAQLVAVRRFAVKRDEAAAGILDQVKNVGRELCQRHAIKAVGIGFGGPIDVATGVITKSHQIEGWDGFPLIDWVRQQLGLPVHVGNDCNLAALAESQLGAGIGSSRVFYVTVGTGVGGGFVVDGVVFGENRPAIAEIGHLRPGLDAGSSDTTIESIASGWGIARTARALIDRQPSSDDAIDLLSRSNQALGHLAAKDVAEAARAGNAIAKEALEQATEALGWAIAQTITLLAPEVVVIGGGVSLIGESDFLEPIRRYAVRFTFPPLAKSFQITTATLGEEVVVHGALRAAFERHQS